MFSRRTGWEASANELTEILNSRISAGRRVIDLTVSNPTACGFPYPAERILGALSSPRSLDYSPDPRGLLSAREAVAGYYSARGAGISTDNIFLTASTSESYSLLFKLLCDPGDEVLVPRPSYPLFDYLAALNDVRTVPYRYSFDGRWEVDAGSVLEGLRRSPRAVVLVDPHNPTGAVVSREAWGKIRDETSRAGSALIIDEVFRDYVFGGSERACLAGNHAGPWDSGPLTFLLNGLSKTAALPQMKVGWIAVAGGPERDGAISRLEILNDTYLSANTPAQAALPELFTAGDSVRRAILERVSENYASLRSIAGAVPGCTVAETAGGWNAVVRLPEGITDGECVRSLLGDEGIYCYPGFFFDFEEDNAIILSLIVPAGEFTEGVKGIAAWTGSRSGGTPA